MVAHAEQAIFEGEIPDTDLIEQVFTSNTIIDVLQSTEKIKVMDYVNR